MIRIFLLLLFFLTQVKGNAGIQSQKLGDLLPFGSCAKICSQATGQLADLQVAQGDLMIVRVDVSHLLHDPKIRPYDIDRLKYPYNYFRTHFSEPDAVKLLAQKSRIYGPENEKMEYLYLIHAKNPGKTVFTTSRTYSIVTGQQEMGEHELNLLGLMIDYRHLLLDYGSNTPSFEKYMNQMLPPSSGVTARVYSEISDNDDDPLETRLALAEQRINQWRNILSKPIRTDFPVHGNNLVIEITPSLRSNVDVGQIHQLRFEQYPLNLEVNEGDIVVVESVRPKEVVNWTGGLGYSPGPYAHIYDAPEVRGIGLHHLYTETLERALLPNDHGSNRLKVYFLVEPSSQAATILVGKPKTSALNYAKEEWNTQIPLNLVPRTKGAVKAPPVSNVALPPILRELSNLEVSQLGPNRVLAPPDVEAIREYYADLIQGKKPTAEKVANVIKFLRPFFGETRNEREYFLSYIGLKNAGPANAFSEVDFDAPNETFFPQLIKALGPKADLARMILAITRIEI